MTYEMPFDVGRGGASGPDQPVVESLLDTDFYKFLMGNFILRNHPDTVVEFSLINRDATVRLADQVDLRELEDQLDHCRGLRFRDAEIDWLGHHPFYGQSRVFSPEYLEFLRHFQLPDYSLSEADGQIVLQTEAPWAAASMWEIPFLTVVGELRHRRIMHPLTRSERAAIYARAEMKVAAKLQRLGSVSDLRLMDFGTRRRHSLHWQQHVVQLAKDALNANFTGTSNCLIAMQSGLEARGTVAHEVSMALAALAPDDEALKAAQYRVCEQWQDMYRGNMLVCLPDTFGTTQFLASAPVWLNHWAGFRHDSKDPVEGGEELIGFWQERNIDPRDRLLIFSDGLDVHVEGSDPNGDDIPTLHQHFRGRTGLAYGFGTNLTNDFRGCAPEGMDLKALPLVAKLSKVNGRGAVKLSDNPSKASGPAGEQARYRSVFGAQGVSPPPDRAP